MRRRSTLLPLFLGMLAARGLASVALDPWRAWVIFKSFARAVGETPDPGVSVQISRVGYSSGVTLYMLRQVLEPDAPRLEPVGGVVCELTFDDAPATTRPFEAWTFDFRSFDHFVDLVESHPAFADLMARRPIRSAVYWEEA